MDNNEETQSEGDIIDVEPEKIEEAPSNNTESDKTTTDKKSPLIIILTVIALVAVTASWVVGYRYWLNINNELTLIQDRINSTLTQQNQLSTEISSAKEVLQQHQVNIDSQETRANQQVEQLSKEKADITRQTETMQLAVAKVNEKISRSNNQWQLAEAEYLLRIANHKLALSHDIETSLTALTQADQLLHLSGDLGLLPIRSQLANEITQLKSIEQTDIAGIAANLHSLARQVDQLKLSGAILTLEKSAPKSDTPDAKRSLDTLLNDSWKGFKELVVIRKHDQPISAMLPPSQQYFLHQNMQLQLQNARLSLLKQENALFINSIETATEWLTQFFDQDDAKTKSMLENLMSLNKSSLTLLYPIFLHHLTC